MEDKILDDDDIIDLTDLLEEGEPPKKAAPKKDLGAKAHGPLNEPDTFDLGKEISMEYDVSVEEIDHGGESLDINGSLSSTEEVALAPDKAVAEEVVLEEKEVKELDLAEDVFDQEPAATSQEAPALEPVQAFSEADLVRGPAGAEAKKPAFVPEPEEPVLVPEDPDVVSFDEIAAPEEPARPAGIRPEAAVEIEAPGRIEAAAKIEFDRRSLDDSPAPAAFSAEDVAAELRQQAPAIIEAIVRPLMAELVKDMIAATREELPGIIEKVIREEIEKLKKLDS
ncbi:MAG TPA: hypothetical protein PK213_02200 [Deltaproteobacteria bacterium]|nr:hypothetical protein [Deltaproteobacteria bacterium]